MNDGLFINGINANTKGVAMGSGFLGTLLAPAGLKDFQTYDARSHHGKQVLSRFPRTASRDISLPFVVFGDTEAEALEAQEWLFNAFSNINISIKIPRLTSDIFRLIYLGKNTSYSLSLSRCIINVTAKFTEADPTFRS